MGKDSKGAPKTLGEAAEAGDLAALKAFLRRKPERKALNGKPGSSSPLARAARRGHYKVVKVLLKEKKVDPNRPEQTGASPLCIASFYGKARCAKALLADPRVDANHKDNYGQTALQVAFSQDKEAVIEALTCCPRTDLSGFVKKHGPYLLLLACRGEAAGRTAELLRAGVDKERALNSGYGVYLLKVACSTGFGDSLLVGLLGDERVRVDHDAAVRYGGRLLFLGAREGMRQVVHRLLARDKEWRHATRAPLATEGEWAPPHAPDAARVPHGIDAEGSGVSPTEAERVGSASALAVASDEGGRRETAGAGTAEGSGVATPEPRLAADLLELGDESIDLDVNWVNAADGKTALLVASERDERDILAMLVELSPQRLDNKEVARASPFSLLFVAASVGSASWMEALLPQVSTAGLLRVDEATHMNVLHVSCEQGHASVVSALLRDGRVPLDAADRFGRPALAVACDNGREDVVTLLVGDGEHNFRGQDLRAITEFLKSSELLPCLRVPPWVRSRINSETRMYGVHIAASGDVFRTISPVRTRRRQGMQAALALARGVIPEGFTRGENGTAVRKLGSKGTLIVRPGKSMVPGRPTFAKCEAVEYNDLKRWQKLNVQRVAVLSLVDCGTDGFVVYDLLSQGHLYWAIAAGSLLGASMLVSSAMLSRMGKTRACWFQLVGLGAAYEAASIILFRKEPDALVDLADPKTGVGALKYAALYEALLESAPQLVLQVYIMMASGIGGVTVGRASSIAVSGISITMAVVAVDFTVGYQKDMSRVRLSIALLLARTTELLARIFLFACIFTVMRPPFLGFLLGLFLLVARIFMWSNGDAPATINALRRTWPGYLLSLVCLPSYAKGLLSPEVLEAPRYCVRRALVLDSVIASIMGLYMIFLSSNTWHNQLGYVLAPTWLAHVFFVQRMHHLYWKRHKKPLLERTEPRRPPGSPSPAHGVSLDDVEVDVEAGSAGAARSAPPAGMESAGSIETDLELARRLEALPSAGAGGGGHTRQWRANQLPSRVGSVGNIAGELALAQRLGAAHSAGKEDGSAPSQQIEAQPSRVGSVSNIAGELALAQRLSGKGEES